MKVYQQFLESKRHRGSEYGIEPISMTDSMFDFQKYVTEYCIKKGRVAAFLDTGLGKTVIELNVAANYHEYTGKPVLIMTPLAVAFQFIKEANKFGIDGVEYCKDGQHKSPIVVCNYERLHYFKPEDFDCVILDESGILKNFEGQLRTRITAFLRKVKYRFLFTATPSPNDFIELGTSSEALGYLGYTDMLTRFFKNNEDTIDPQKIGVEWVLKGHAKNAFFEWVSGWSISMRKPSDLGFSDERHKLPELIIQDHQVKNPNNLVNDAGQIELINRIARTRSEINQEQKMTVHERCKLAVELASKHDVSVYWCNLNNEGDLLGKLDASAVEIRGSMDIDRKEEILMAFSEGQIKKLISKASITCFGLNWQHCNHSVFFPTFSYEQWYQAVRRFWRFGQNNTVVIDRVLSDGQKRILDSLNAKTKKADELFDKLNLNINKKYDITEKQFSQSVKLPSFL